MHRRNDGTLAIGGRRVLFPTSARTAPFNRRGRGFSLVELVVVVGVAGILAMTATYGARKYTTNAMTTEAKTNLGRLGKDAVAVFEREDMAGALLARNAGAASRHQLCASAAAAVPTTVPRGQKIQPNPSAWAAGNATTGWRCLKFSINSPLYFQYRYTATNPTNANSAAFTATATGDLDGDGTAGTPWTLRGGVVNRVMRLAPTLVEAADPSE
jgi:type IV pilus assembly protein PilA